jgi:methylated-DNA-[protein]-cysteine S-methyltransferase
MEPVVSDAMPGEWLVAGVIPSPLGDLTAIVTERGHLAGLDFSDTAAFTAHAADAVQWRGVAVARDDAAVQSVAEQLAGYFAGEVRAFTVTLAPRGNDFHQAVWAELQSIPYGETISYGALAAKLGKPGAARAVGRANGSNPIAIIVPCHRVVGADGALTGYAGGLDRKRALLALERCSTPTGQQTLLW